MFASVTRATSLLLVLSSLTACSGSEESEQENREESKLDVVAGYVGGCSDGFTVYTQNQFKPYGALVRARLDQKGQSAGLYGNDPLVAVGWTRTDEVLYPDNPEGIRGEVWYFIPSQRGWVADAGVRGLLTEHARGDRADEYEPGQAAPQPEECELTEMN